MRQDVQSLQIKLMFEELARLAKGPGRIYVTGGATAVLLGWRNSTVDIDIKLMPEPAGVFEAIRDLKNKLRVNIELASPDDFIPALPNWQERSQFILSANGVEFYHYDFYSQALSKIERGHVRDIGDVKAMLQNGHIEKHELAKLFSQIEPQLIRFPSIDAAVFKEKVEAVLGQIP